MDGLGLSIEAGDCGPPTCVSVAASAASRRQRTAIGHLLDARLGIKEHPLLNIALREGGFVESLRPIRATPLTEPRTPHEHPQTGRLGSPHRPQSVGGAVTITNVLVLFGGSKDGAFNQEISDLVGQVRVARRTWQTGAMAGRTFPAKISRSCAPKRSANSRIARRLFSPRTANPSSPGWLAVSTAKPAASSWPAGASYAPGSPKDRFGCPRPRHGTPPPSPKRDLAESLLTRSPTCDRRYPAESPDECAH